MRPKHIPRRELVGNQIVDTHLDHSDSYRMEESDSQAEEAKIQPFQTVSEAETIESKKLKLDAYRDKWQSRAEWDKE